MYESTLIITDYKEELSKLKKQVRGWVINGIDLFDHRKFNFYILPKYIYTYIENKMAIENLMNNTSNSFLEK
jgi:hypothetical protein